MDHDQSQEELRRNERRYRALLQASLQVVWTVGAAGITDESHARWAQMTGQSSAESAGWGWLSALHPDDRDRVCNAWAAALEQESLFDTEYRVLSPQGEYRHYAVRGVPLFTVAGDLEEWVGTWTDITDSKRAEALLRELNADLERRVAERTRAAEQRAAALARSEAELKRQSLVLESILNSMGEGVVLADETGQTVLRNRAARELYGIGPHVQLDLRDSVHSLFKLDGETPFPVEQLPLVLAIEGRATDDVEMVIRNPVHPAGVIMSVSGRPLRTDNGEAQGGVVVLRDITTRRANEDALRESQDRFQSAFEYASIGKALVALDGHWLRVNRAICEIVGYSESELLATDFQTITHPEDLDADLNYVGQLLAGEIQSYQMEKRYFHKRGHVVYVLLSVSLVRDAGGNPLYLISQIQDISQRKQALAELERAKAAAEQASRSKSEFLANMSHEIRTPMTAILGYADLVLDDNALSQSARESARTIKRNGEHLLAIINDILDLSKIEAGKLIIEQLPCSPREIVADVVNLLHFRAEEKGLRLDVEFGRELPTTILSDPTRLRQIVMNLVGNAIKFTKSGSVRIHVCWQANDAADPTLLIEIQDTGIGMTPQQYSTLFQSFQQADSSMSRQFGGTGLGLAISQRLARLMGGTILCASEFGKGTTFCVTVDARPAALPGAGQAGRHPPDGTTMESTSTANSRPLDHARILLAEDTPDSRYLLLSLLQKAGATVTTAENGRIACDLALEARAREQPFDVILMDMQMPVCDGYQATAELRERGYREPVLALTAHSMPVNRQKCLAAGCDDFLTKPVDRKLLIASVKQWLRQERSEFAGEPVQLPSGGQPREAGRSVEAREIIRHFDGEVELCRSLIQLFREHSPQLLTDIQVGIATRNTQLVRRAAHSLKGSVGIFGTTAAFEAAARLEALAIERDNDAMPRVWEQVASTVFDLNEILNQIAELTPGEVIAN